ncbi:hypothetical protein MP638_004319 [Amoeboaphelidium occidentale]|nr:hypothetical protein MP638_004319 [Amoeboaphelidium occidentale]
MLSAPSITYLCLAGLFLTYSITAIVFHLCYFIRKGLQNGKSQGVTIRSLLFDRHSELNKRSTLLNVLTLLGFTGIVVDGWVGISSTMFNEWDYNCRIAIVTKYIVWIWGLYGFTARSLRLYLKFVLNTANKSAPAADISKLDDSSIYSSNSVTAATGLMLPHATLPNNGNNSSGVGKYEKNEIVYVLAVVGLSLVLLAINFLAGMNTTWFAPGSRDGCMRSNAFILVWSFVGMYVVIVSPLLLYILNRKKDAYYLRDATTFGIQIGLPGYILFFILSFVTRAGPIKSILDPTNIPYIIICVMHFYCSVMPVLKDMQEKSIKLARNYQSFIETISNTETYDQLQECAAEEFSTENVAFWNSYVFVMRKVYKELVLAIENNGLKVTGIPGLTKGSGSGFKDISHLKSELLKVDSQELPSVLAAKNAVTEGNRALAKIPMKLSVASMFIEIYETFIVADSRYELNIPSSERKQIEQVINPLNERVSKFLEGFEPQPEQYPQSPLLALTNVALPKKQGRKDPEILGILLVFTDDNYECRVTEGVLEVPVKLFDSVKDHILAILYENTFARFLAKQRLKTIIDDKEDNGSKVVPIRSIVVE